MLKLTNVNKYFNRHKKNEIHVINNTSLELGDTGLVALLGPSGCGKTTLLNAIGGLNKINSGKIYINGKKMSTRFTPYKDKLRVLNVGYIFQDYNLLENLTVFENVALSLKMIGVKNKSEIKRKVEYCLEKVGMYRYRNKLAGNLSGGEKQRVGIARAIVKNPAIIIADEPTGNLDSKNTIEVMNIIKSISKEKLVILVTHEKNLAHFYASRIVDIEDGKIISDRDNEHENELDYRIDNKFYLKDFSKHEIAKTDDYQLDFYSDEKESIDLDIVIKNGNIYIKSNNFNKIEVVDDSSSIEFVDEHYKKISKEDYEKNDFDLSELDNSKHKTHYASIYNVFTMIKAGVKKVFGYTMMKKILLLGFAVSAMFIVYSISNIFGVLNIKDSKFVTTNREYISIANKKNNVEAYLKLEENDKTNYMIPGDSQMSAELKNRIIYQFNDASAAFDYSLASLSLIEENDLVLGTMPKEENEILIDSMTIEKATVNPNFAMIGINSEENFIGKKITIDEKLELTITGVVSKDSPSIYANENIFVYIIAGNIVSKSGSDAEYKDYERYRDDFTLKGGKLPEGNYEVLVNVDLKEAYPLNKTMDAKINGKKLKVVGYYESKKGENAYFINKNTLKIDNISKLKGISVYSKDKEDMLSYLKDNKFNAADSYVRARDKYMEDAKDSIVQSLIIAGILLAISFVEIFLMIRASFMSRVKEVGIYRAIGAKKTDIYKMFLGEILVITTLAGVPGYLLMASVLKEVSKIAYVKDMFMIDAKVLILSLVLIYGLNIIVGLLPISSTVRKAPADILSRNDVD